MKRQSLRRANGWILIKTIFGMVFIAPNMPLRISFRHPVERAEWIWWASTPDVRGRGTLSSDERPSEI